jgi:two-component system, OmpR family, sensor kinase
MNGGRPRLTSLRNKLALLFLGITAAAFGVIYFFVVPQLQSSLEDARLDELTRVADASGPTLEQLMGSRQATATTLDRRVRSVADAAGARVTLIGVQRSRGGEDAPRTFVITDSREERRVPENDALVDRAIRTGNLARGKGSFEGAPQGELAQPLYYRGRVDWLALYTRSFADVNETVTFIQNRLLLATAAALIVALGGGYMVAQALSRRVRRVEQAAQQVAAGRFIEPLPVDSADELGQLTQAFNEMQVQLRRVDVTRKEFVATASHELRTPIFSLGGFVELLRDEDMDADTRREFLETMAEQVERLQKLAVDLLDLSRLDAGSVELERDAVDLSALAREVIGEFTPAVARHETQLELRLPARVRATCDRERVAQIVRILLDNALRHTPEGTHVTVSAGRVDGHITLTVADRGPGLPDRDQVFERFYTGDATQGAGLGLAIARELAERMDGSLRADANGAGSAFTLELPAFSGRPAT